MPAAHLRYLGKQTRFPTRPPKTPDGFDRLLSEIRRGIPNPTWWEIPRQACISPETWRLIDTRIAARRHKDGAQRSSKTLRRKIKAIIQEGRRQREIEAGSAVESLLSSDLPLLREAWINMWGCYKEAVDRPTPPDRMAISTMMVNKVKLYQHFPPPGYLISVGVKPFLVNESIPEDQQIAWAVLRLRLNRSGGPLGIRA